MWGDTFRLAMSEAAAVDLDGFTPSAKFLYKVLEEADGGKSASELADETRLEASTVRSELRKLYDAGLIDRQYDVLSPNQKLYGINLSA